MEGGQAVSLHLQEIESLQNSLREREKYVTELENRLRALWDKLEGERKHYMNRIKRLEEALEATAKVIGPPGKSTWVSDDELNHAWELYIKAKEAKP
jgi:DNA repair exonuclease SbcCD ATPase subunit